MTNLEKYKNEIEKYPGGEPIMCKVAKLRGRIYCRIAPCNDCNLESLDWLNEEYKEPKIKLTKKEYDLLNWYDNESLCCFDDYDILNDMKEKGYFKSIKNTSVKISNILANCEVVEK